MLWCLIFHQAELQNYVPALHGIMFGSFIFNKKCHKLCSTLLELCWKYFTYNQAGSFLSLVELCSAPLNYVWKAASRITFGKQTGSLTIRNSRGVPGRETFPALSIIYSSYYQCSCSVLSNMVDESISVEFSRHVTDIIGFLQRSTGMVRMM